MVMHRQLWTPEFDSHRTFNLQLTEWSHSLPNTVIKAPLAMICDLLHVFRIVFRVSSSSFATISSYHREHITDDSGKWWTVFLILSTYESTIHPTCGLSMIETRLTRRKEHARRHPGLPEVEKKRDHGSKSFQWSKSPERLNKKWFLVETSTTDQPEIPKIPFHSQPRDFLRPMWSRIDSMVNCGVRQAHILWSSCLTIPRWTHSSWTKNSTNVNK